MSNFYRKSCKKNRLVESRKYEGFVVVSSYDHRELSPLATPRTMIKTDNVAFFELGKIPYTSPPSTRLKSHLPF